MFQSNSYNLYNPDNVYSKSHGKYLNSRKNNHIDILWGFCWPHSTTVEFQQGQ